jgi:hypothetical protein
MMLSAYLVATSAFMIHQVLGYISLIGSILVVSVSLYMWYLARLSMITIRREGEWLLLDSYVPIYFFFLICGFTQTLFWVMDSQTSTHEPRSVFIIGIGAAIAYMRQQYINGSSILAKYQ